MPYAVDGFRMVGDSLMLLVVLRNTLIHFELLDSTFFLVAIFALKEHDTRK